MKILCFGIAKDIVGKSELALDSSVVRSVSELKSYLLESFPEFKKYKSFMIAVNQAYADDALMLNGNEEIAIIPPVSGG